MLDQWLETHKNEILDHYVAWRLETGDPRPVEVIRVTTERFVNNLQRTFRGDEDFDFLQSSMASAERALTMGVPLEPFAEASHRLFLAIRHVMEQDRPAQRSEWLGAVGDLLLQGSRGLIRALATNMERQKVQVETLYHLSRNLNQARDANDVLQVVIQIAQGAGASGADLLYVDLDEDDAPEWGEVRASWRRQDDIPSVPPGTRYYLPEFPLARLWLSRPEEAQTIADVSADARLDDNTRDMLVQGGVRALLIMPLVQAGQWVGLLTCSWSEPHEFEQQALGTYHSLGGLVSPTVAGLRLVRNLERMVEERTAESTRLQQKVIEAQQQALKELSTPIIPIMDAPGGAGGILVLPLVGDIDSARARDIMRALLEGIRRHRASVIILDITGVPVVDSGVAAHLHKTIRAAQLKGAQTIITGISEKVAETIVELGIDWGKLDTLSDLQTGLVAALDKVGRRIV